MSEYDLIIIGGGPAGLSAGLYASRGKLKTLIIEKLGIGGQIVTTTEVENYPGAPKDSTGPSIVERMKEQCDFFGCEFITDNVEKVEKKGKLFYINSKNNEYISKTCIIASGAQPKMLGVKGEEEFRGMGVSYCATCDAGFYKGLEAVVVGGGDTALKEALYLTKFANKVTLIHRRGEFRGGRALEEKVRNNEKISLILNSEIKEISGKDFVENIIIFDKKENKEYEYKTDGVFLFVGYKPNSEIFNNVTHQDKEGYIITNESLQTITAGLYAAGDVRSKSLRQVITAASDGAIAATEAEMFIENVFN